MQATRKMPKTHVEIFLTFLFSTWNYDYSSLQRAIHVLQSLQAIGGVRYRAQPGKDNSVEYISTEKMRTDYTVAIEEEATGAQHLSDWSSCNAHGFIVLCRLQEQD